MHEIPAPSLKLLTTIRLGGNAQQELILDDKNDIYAIPDILSQYGSQLLIIGNGSNLIALEGNLPLVLLKNSIYDPPRIIEEKNNLVFVKVGASTKLASFSGFCFRHGLSGMEGLCGIPATIGGAIAMNAGSFGQAICDCLEELVVATEKGIFSVKKDQIYPEYRCLHLHDMKPGWMVIEAIFALTRGAKDGICKNMNLNFFNKKSRQPITSKTAGCIFKNPFPFISAGKLLDKAGFRGKKLGGMAFSSLHANFLVNESEGSTQAALALIGQAKEKVWQEFGYKLDLEVKIVPCP